MSVGKFTMLDQLDPVLGIHAQVIIETADYDNPLDIRPLLRVGIGLREILAIRFADGVIDDSGVLEANELPAHVQSMFIGAESLESLLIIKLFLADPTSVAGAIGKPVYCEQLMWTVAADEGDW